MCLRYIGENIKYKTSYLSTYPLLMENGVLFKPLSERASLSWLSALDAVGQSPKRDHTTKCYYDDCEVQLEVAHLNQCHLTCAKAERGCVLIIRGRDRKGAAVCTICGLWHYYSRKMNFRCEATRWPLSTVPTVGPQVRLPASAR